jgi:hypothetical protein
MLDWFLGRIFLLFTIKKNLKVFHFFVDFLTIDMVLFYNGMIVKIIFLSPSHYKVNITRISDKSKEVARKKKSFFFETRFIVKIANYLEIICINLP